MLGLILVVLSSVLSNDPGCSNPLLGYSNEPVNVIGLNDRLPMLFFLAMSTVQIAAIVSGNENKIMVCNVLKHFFGVQTTTIKLSGFEKVLFVSYSLCIS